MKGHEGDNGKLNDKINMEAYQAYYNTNENSIEPEASNNTGSNKD